ncbi:hypothetical protein HYX70_02630 [Candidatus Saccharibacteria bacterium]|nr:hypothetical protein [Candidatus Saccharibacteria bacterium]
MFKNNVGFESKVSFGNTITVSNNTAGTVKIPAGQTNLRLEFTRPYSKPPVINVTPIGIVSPKYGVVNVTEKGFEIQIDPAQESELQFNWFAVETSDNF